MERGFWEDGVSSSREFKSQVCLVKIGQLGRQNQNFMENIYQDKVSCTNSKTWLGNMLGKITNSFNTCVVSAIV